MSPKALSRSGGFTLLEVVMALAVVSLILLGIITSNVIMQKNSEAAFERTRAVQDANQVLERMRDLANSGLFPDTVVAAYPNNGTVAGFSTLPSEVITVTYTDNGGDAIATNDIPLDVTVTVTWLQNGTRTATAELRGMVARRNYA